MGKLTFTAPEFDGFLDTRQIRGLEYLKYDEATMKTANEVFDLLRDRVKSSDAADEVHSFWFPVPRGDVMAYGSYSDMKEDGCVENWNDYLKQWKEDYPDAEKWYWFTFVRSQYGAMISVDNKTVFCTAYNEEMLNDRFERDETEMLSLMKEVAAKLVEMVKKGTYERFLEKNLPVYSRFGVIAAKDYYASRQEEEKSFYEFCSLEDAKRFAKIAGSAAHDDRNAQPDRNGLPEMTASDYLRISAMGYRKIFPDQCKGKTDRELYKRFADGRDGGFSSILLEHAPDNAEAFRKWFLQEDKWRAYEENDSHLWEAIEGSSATRVNLFPVYSEDKGWTFMIAYSECSMDYAAALFLALYDNGIPVWMYGAKDAARYLTMQDQIGIIPGNFDIWGYSGSRFPVSGVNTCINLERGIDDDLIPFIEWLPVHKLEKAERKDEIGRE